MFEKVFSKGFVHGGDTLRDRTEGIIGSEGGTPRESTGVAPAERMRQRDHLQRDAVLKRMITESGKIRGHADVRQRRASVERVLSDHQHIVRDPDAFQARAPGKSPLADGDQRLRQRNAFQLRTFPERFRADVRDAFRHLEFDRVLRDHP